jgi:hypothetical protein
MPSKPKSSKPKSNTYEQIITRIFLDHYTDGMTEFTFERSEINVIARELNIEAPSNVGDIVYAYRYRKSFPEVITSKAPAGKVWVIKGVGDARYQFAAVIEQDFSPNPNLEPVKIPDATPGIVAMYALGDEQALLAKLRYNRLIDIFTGVTCYSLQNHLRTKVKGKGQIEVDELYIGIDQNGLHYAIPVQAKGGTDRLSIVQIEQDVALCAEKYSGLVCKPIAAQFMTNDVIVLFEMVINDDVVQILKEQQYQLVTSTSSEN